jgi:hypothetical protein
VPRGPVVLIIPFYQLQQGGQAVEDPAPRLRAFLIYLLFNRVRHQLHVPVLGLSEYNRLTARVTVLLAAETNERALRVLISRKSRYFVLIDPIKAELEGRRELTAECTTTDEGKKIDLIASNRPFCTEKRFATCENNDGSDYLRLTR